MAFHKKLIHEESIKEFIKAYLLEQDFARIQYGTYTGNGATSLDVATRFDPEWVIITLDGTGADSGVWFCTKQMAADESQELISAGAATASVDKNANQIIALGTLKFTVDDAAGDAHPNKNNQVYDFIVIG